MLKHSHLLLSRSSGHVPNPVLALGLTTVSDLDFEAFDLFGKPNSLSIVQRSLLHAHGLELEYVLEELDDRLRFVESCGTHW